MCSKAVGELEDALGRLLLRSNRLRLLEAALQAAPAGVDRGTYSVLSGIARLGPSTSVALAAEIGLDRTGTSRYADRLVNAGLLTRRPHPHDGRATLLALTTKGRRAVTKMREALVENLKVRTAGLGEAELAALVAGLRLLVDPPLRDGT